MAATTTTDHEAATKSADEDTRDGARTVSKRAAKAQDMVSEAEYSTLQTMSRMVYTGSYALAYGVVYAVVFVAQSLPPGEPCHALVPRRRTGSHGRSRHRLTDGRSASPGARWRCVFAPMRWWQPVAAQYLLHPRA